MYMTLWMTGDGHYGHSRIRQHCNRAFETCDEMNQFLVDNINRVVKPNDILYNLGDLAWDECHANWFFDRVVCRHIVHIWGNHDRRCRNVIQRRAESTHDMLEITVPDKDAAGGMQRVVLCHYALRVWPGGNRGAYNLYAHSHGNLPPNGLQMDVGVDPNNYRPVSYDDVKAHMLKQMVRGCLSCVYWCRNCRVCKLASKGQDPGACVRAGHTLYKSRFESHGPEDAGA